MAAGRHKNYGFAVDMYSLGVVLLDMFRRHDLFHQELSKIHDALRRGKVEESLAKKMEPNVVLLIERLISGDPEKRPTIMEVLTSELLPQEEVLSKLQQHLLNHKNPLKLRLIRFLAALPTPKSLDVTYSGHYKYQEVLENSTP